MWGFLLAVAVAVVAMYALAPKPERQPPPGVEDLEAPVAEDGKEIPVLFGCRDIRGPNVVWYGNLRTVAIKSKAGKK